MGICREVVSIPCVKPKPVENASLKLLDNGGHVTLCDQSNALNV